MGCGCIWGAQWISPVRLVVDRPFPAELLADTVMRPSRAAHEAGTSLRPWLQLGGSCPLLSPPQPASALAVWDNRAGPLDNGTSVIRPLIRRDGQAGFPGRAGSNKGFIHSMPRKFGRTPQMGRSREGRSRPVPALCSLRRVNLCSLESSAGTYDLNSLSMKALACRMEGQARRQIAGLGSDQESRFR